VSEAMELPITDTGLIDLGPMNKSAIKRLANHAQYIVDNNLPVPESPFINLVAERITGRDKQDFRMIITGDTGEGKSYTAIYIAPRIAEAVAAIRGGTKDDYFSLDNCALLEDSEGINKVLKIAKKYQIIVIDDAGTAVGSRDFATVQNKNFNRLLATCRTQRWCLILTVPLKSHLDKQIRELVYVNARIYKSFHEGGFNILKMGKSKVLEYRGDKVIYPKFTFEGRKIDFWVAFSPDKQLAEEYDIRRDAAAQKLIAESITGDEIAKLSPRKQRLLQVERDHLEPVRKIKGRSVRSIMIEEGLTDAEVRHLLSKIRQEEKGKGKKE
jgi:hypothetical protein